MKSIDTTVAIRFIVLVFAAFGATAIIDYLLSDEFKQDYKFVYMMIISVVGIILVEIVRPHLITWTESLPSASLVPASYTTNQ